MNFIYSVKGVSPPSAELTCCVRCDFPTWKGMHVLRAWFQTGGQLHAILFLGCDTLTCGQKECSRSSAPGGRQRADVAFAAVLPGVLHSAEAVDMGTFTAPALLPRTEDAGSGVLWLCFHQPEFSRQFAVPASKDTDPSAISMAPSPRVCDWQGRGNQGVRLELFLLCLITFC